jgi:diguanylate cyclase (GGDEF)-like protein
MARQAGTSFALAGGAFDGLLCLLVPRSGGSGVGRAATLVLAALLLLLGAAGRYKPESIPDAVWALLPSGAAIIITTLNLVTSDASAGAQVFFVWPVLYASYLLRPYAAGLVLGLVAASEVLVVTQVGSRTPVADIASLVTTFGVMTLVIVKLRNRLDDSLSALAEQALRDPLTGLLNRRAFDQRLAELIPADATEPATLSVLALDLDNLKTINDRDGHAAGDRALRQVATALHVSVRADDLVFRVGGDEFCVVLPGCTRIDAMRRAHEFRTVLAQLVGDPLLTVSVGIATSPEDGAGAESLLAHADRALYGAKRSGRDRVSA